MKPDSSLNLLVEKDIKPAREQLVASMLVTDEFGNEIPSKSYEQLSTKELNLLTENIVVRLNLFKNKYPAFLPQAVRAIMEHPNISRTDRSALETYCTLFELDWRGDRHVDNQDKFLYQNPIYMNDSQASSLAPYRDLDRPKMIH